MSIQLRTARGRAVGNIQGAKGWRRASESQEHSMMRLANSVTSDPSGSANLASTPAPISRASMGPLDRGRRWQVEGGWKSSHALRHG